MRFHLNDAEVARSVTNRLRGPLKQRGHPRTHTKRFEAVAAMLGYANWADLLIHCPTTEPASRLDEELDAGALNERLQQQAEALARAVHIPQTVAVDVIAAVRPTGRASQRDVSVGPGVEDIVLQRHIPGRPGQALSFFVHGIELWWPNAFTSSMAELDSITIESKQEGRWYETSTAGDEIDWGVVITWEQQQRLVLTFQVSGPRLLRSASPSSRWSCSACTWLYRSSSGMPWSCTCSPSV